MSLESAKTGPSLYSQLLGPPLKVIIPKLMCSFSFSNRTDFLTHTVVLLMTASPSKQPPPSFSIWEAPSLVLELSPGSFPHLLFPPCKGLLEAAEVLEGRCSVAFLVLLPSSLKQKSLGLLSSIKNKQGYDSWKRKKKLIMPFWIWFSIK